MPTLTESYSDLETWTPTYERWRHGGWYVTNIRYPDGAIGCVHNNHVRKTHCKRGHEFKEGSYRSFVRPGKGVIRVCKACARIRRLKSKGRLA